MNQQDPFIQPSDMLLNEIKEAEANGVLIIVNVVLRLIGNEIRFIPRVGDP